MKGGKRRRAEMSSLRYVQTCIGPKLRGYNSMTTLGHLRELQMCNFLDKLPGKGSLLREFIIKMHVLPQGPHSDSSCPIFSEGMHLRAQINIQTFPTHRLCKPHGIIQKGTQQAVAELQFSVLLCSCFNPEVKNFGCSRMDKVIKVVL